MEADDVVASPAAPRPTPPRGSARGRSPATPQEPAAAAPAPTPSRSPAVDRKRRFGKRERGLEGNYGPTEVMEASIGETMCVFSHPNLNAIRRGDPLEDDVLKVWVSIEGVVQLHSNPLVSV